MAALSLNLLEATALNLRLYRQCVGVATAGGTEVAVLSRSATSARGGLVTGIVLS